MSALAAIVSALAAAVAGPQRGSLADRSIDWPAWGEAWSVLTFSRGFNTSVVVLSTTLLGVAAGTIGTFGLLRGRALMADALSHAALPGIALAFLLATALGADGQNLALLLAGATLTGVLGLLCVQAIVSCTRLRQDAAIAAVLSVFFGAGVVLLSVIQQLGVSGQGGLGRFIYGQTAAMRQADAVVIGAAGAACIAACAALFKPFRLVCFDRGFAAAIGWRVAGIDLVMMALVVGVTVIGLQAVGLLLVVAMLIVPAAAARFWSERLWAVAVLGGALGGLSGYLGACASALLERMPAGAVIVLTAGGVFFLSLLAAPSRGVVAAGVRLGMLRLRVAREHLLRGLYERAEQAGVAGPGAGVEWAALGRGGAGPARRVVLRTLAAAGHVRLTPAGVALTDRGWREAARLTRNHRLWEEYLVRFADVAPSHVDRSADLVEHTLDEGLVRELESALRERGRLPGVGASVHPIPPARGGGDVSGPGPPSPARAGEGGVGDSP